MIKNISAAVALSAAVLSLGLAAAPANAQAQGYVVDQRGAVVKNTYGLCWHTGNWTPGLANEACDPDLMPKRVSAPIAPQPMRAAPAPAATPTPVAPIAAAPVAPVIVAAPAAPRREKIELSADTLFTFGKSELRPTAKVKLDEMVERMKGVDPESILVSGHADRLGNVAFNRDLSMQRAGSIKTYLVGKGIASEDIKVSGKGETEPVTKASECTGPKNAKLIACLQPDRRVEIEMVGTRLR